MRRNEAQEGVLEIAGYWSEQACARVRAAMDRGVSEAAEVVDHGYTLQPEVRRSSYVEVDRVTQSWVDAQLIRAKGPVAQHFGLALTDNEGAALLRYRDGGFYRRHIDTPDDASEPSLRVISVVLFLNGAEAFAGGALRIYRSERNAVDIMPVAGLLVAFPSRVPHEVLPVSGGVRDVVVDWFY